MAQLFETKNYQIDYFKDFERESKTKGVLCVNHSFGWSPKVEHGRGIVFTVFAKCFKQEAGQSIIFLEVSQQFWLYDIINDLDSYEVLKQCVYINYDSLIRVLEIKFDWFKSAYDFSPLDEVLLERDLGVMLNNLP